MSKNRVSPDAGWVDYDKLARGPNGRALCRKCGVEVPKGRRTFCSDGCVHEWRVRTDPGYLRRQTFMRDKGICAGCRWDTEKFRRVMRHVARERQNEQDRFGQHPAYRATYEALGLSKYQHGSLWQADHIVPVIEGGGECGLENIRTLCTVCHIAETAALRRRLAGKPEPLPSSQEVLDFSTSTEATA